jgi:hypothetical protein
MMHPNEDLRSIERNGSEKNHLSTVYPQREITHPSPNAGETGGRKTKKTGREPTKSVGVSLTTSEWARIDAIASNLRMKRGALLAYAVRLFLKLYESGQLTETSEVLKKL